MLLLYKTFSVYSLLKSSVQERITNTFFALFGLYQYNAAAASAEEKIILPK